MRKDFGKSWKNEDIDDVLAAKYYIKFEQQHGLKISKFSGILTSPVTA